MTVVTRFAPSPRGLLPVGNIYIALVNRLFAREAGGRDNGPEMKNLLPLIGRKRALDRFAGRTA